MNSKFDPSVEIKRTVLDLIQNLREDVFTSSDENGDLNIVEFFFQRMHHEKIMNHFVQKILPYKKQISARDINFFLNNESLFAGLPEDKVRHYSTVIASGKRIDQEYRNTIWEYFDSLIALAELYQKNK